MNRTQIEWVKNPDGTQGYTWNPITGCLNGCPYCYARKLANGRLKQRYLANNYGTPQEDILDYGRDMKDPFYPRFWIDRLWQPAREPEGKKKSLGIFAVDMGELFGNWIPDNWQASVFKVIRTCHYHRFYLLTKQPQNLIKWSPFPANCFVGVTATDTYMAIKGLRALDNIVAKVKYMSFEPLLEQTCITPTSLSGLDWVIIGAQTKPYKPPKIEWVEEIVRACDKAGIPVFLKDNLKPLFAETVTIDDKWVWAKDRGYGGLYRQEMPE